MRWVVWKAILGEPAQDVSVGKLVYFCRGVVPELGKVVGTGNDVRGVPLMRCNEAGSVSTRRTYWRQRSQLYVRRRGQ